MKTLKLIVLFSFVVSLFACKKEKEISAVGYWTGWWSSGSGSSTQNKMATVFRNNGTVRVIYGYTADTATAVYKLEGTYTVDGDILRFRYSEGSYTFIHKATLAKNMNGTWGNAPSETNAGLFALSKQ